MNIFWLLLGCGSEFVWWWVVVNIFCMMVGGGEYILADGGWWHCLFSLNLFEIVYIVCIYFYNYSSCSFSRKYDFHLYFLS